MIEKRLRLSGRLWLLVLLALLPVFVLQLNAARLRFDDVERFARVQVTRFVSYAGAFQGDFLMDAETIMAIAARQADIAEAAPGECDVALGYVLTDSAQRRKIFHSLTLARPDGSVLCSALPFSAGLSMADQTYFRNAIQSGRFAIGERMIDPVSKQLALMVAEPIKNEAGELVSILVSAIDLTPAMRLAEPLLTPGAAMAVFMDDGSHLLRMPVIEGIDLSRTKVPGPLLEAARAADVGTVVTAGIDGVERLYATRKIPLFGNLVYVALGYPNDAIFAPAKAELWRTIGVILLVTAVALVLSWLLGNFMIRRPLRELLTATEKLSAGDFKARTKIRGKSEIDDLMAAFNRTAESLEKHEDAVQSEVARRRRTEHSLKETNNRLMAIIESSPLAIVGLSAKSEVILWNRASENLFSFDSSEVMDQPSPLAAAEGDDPFAGLFAQARRGKAIREMRIKLRRKGEGSFEARFSGGPIRGQAGEFHGLIYVIEDVTHTKQVEAQLAQSQRMEAVGQLTGGIAHDFNNLLGVVIGNLDLARETPKLDPDVVEPLEASTNAALRGAELTRQLLAFSRRQPLHAKALGKL